MNEYTYSEITIGQEETFSVTVTSEKVKAFSEITGDINPLHIDENYAKSKNYTDKVVYGMLTASFLSTLAGMYLPGKYSVIHSVEVKFLKPVYVDPDVMLTVTGKVVEKNDTFQRITLKITIISNDQEKVCRGTMKIGVLSDS